jgi:superfamily II RNA helicase
MANNIITDISEVDRTVNYIQFQISQADELLAPFANSDKPKICYAHLLEWKKTLQSELHEIRKAQNKARYHK